jgi:hypothetical protein
VIAEKLRGMVVPPPVLPPVLPLNLYNVVALSIPHEYLTKLIVPIPSVTKSRCRLT